MLKGLQLAGPLHVSVRCQELSIKPLTKASLGLGDSFPELTSRIKAPWHSEMFYTNWFRV